MLAYILSKLVTLTYGLMYPAYCSFKAVKTKDVREYVNWMMYWIAFAVFSVVEVFADTFIGCWFPFYYEGKIIFLLWMISSSTRGGAILYRRYIHPSLIRHEEEIDACLADFKAKASGAVMKWGYRVLTSMSEIIMQATFRGGEPLFDNFRRSCSMNDLNRGFNQRYVGNPQGGRDILDGFALSGPNSEIYFERNVPVQSIGDHEMIEADVLSENNIDRRLVRERLLSVDPILEEGVPSDLEQAESRRLRSSTRKRNVERGAAGREFLSREGTPVHLVYGWYPTSPVVPNAFPINFNPTLHIQNDLALSPDSISIESDGDAEVEHSGSDSDEFHDCETESKIISQQNSHVFPESSSSVRTPSTAKPSSVKTVEKTVLRGFEAPSAVNTELLSPKKSFVHNAKTRIPSTVQALVTDPLHVISSVSTPIMTKEIRQKSFVNLSDGENIGVNKLKQSKSFAGRSNASDDRVKSGSSWQASSFRRVFHPFATPKPVPPSFSKSVPSSSSVSTASNPESDSQSSSKRK